LLQARAVNGGAEEEVRGSDRGLTIDVVFDHGISELATRQSEYQGLLASGGIKKLIDALEHQAERMLPRQQK
jgi:hypothetical protein